MCFLRLQNYIPKIYQKNLYNVDYGKLYEEGYKLILMDLDNTLLGYQEQELSKEKEELVKRIQEIGFKIILITNNHKKRIEKIAKTLNVDFAYSVRKPFGYKLKKLMEKNNFTSSNTICIGDQLVTDIQAGNKLSLYTILIDSIDRKKEIFITRINRRIEKRALKKLKKKYPQKYEILREYDRRNYHE